MLFRSYSTAAIAATATILISTGSFLPTADAAAGYPLVRESMIFHPLSCNSDLDSADCSSTSLESIIASTTANNNNATSEILIPCGTCATLTTSDGSTLDLSSSTINIEGKLYVPPSAHVTIRTRGMFIQGELTIDPPEGLDGLRVQLVGVEDVVFVPNGENVEKCGVGGCNEGSKPVVVSILHLNDDVLFTIFMYYISNTAIYVSSSIHEILLTSYLYLLIFIFLSLACLNHDHVVFIILSLASSCD